MTSLPQRQFSFIIYQPKMNFKAYHYQAIIAVSHLPPFITFWHNNSNALKSIQHALIDKVKAFHFITSARLLSSLESRLQNAIQHRNVHQSSQLTNALLGQDFWLIIWFTWNTVQCILIVFSIDVAVVVTINSSYYNYSFYYNYISSCS